MYDKKRISKFTFHFKPESVIMQYQSQVICFNNFKLRNKTKLVTFSDSIKTARKMDLNTVFTLAKDFDVPSISVTTACIPKTTAYVTKPPSDNDPKTNSARIS